MSQDIVRLSVPARGEYAKTVRMTAASLVSRMGMTFDEIDDVRIAAEEAFVYAAESMADGDPVELEFGLEGDVLTLTVALGVEAQLTDEEVERRTSYATFILESVCDSFELMTDESGVSFMRLVKRAESVDAD